VARQFANKDGKEAVEIIKMEKKKDKSIEYKY